MNEYKNSENLVDKNGIQYHIGLEAKDIANYVIFVGDPKRLKLFESLFDTIDVKKGNREFLSITGKYKGIDLTVMATGMGAENTEIAIIELCQLKFPITVIRCGTCGSLQKDINIGDLVISSGALRLENTTSYFVENNYPAISDYEISIALLRSAYEKNVEHHFGITATAPGFYGAQCRNIKGFPVKDPDLIRRLTKQNVKNLEMETSALLVLSNLRGFRAGSICGVLASRIDNKFVSPDLLKEVEKKTVDVCLNAVEILFDMDSKKGSKRYWIPNV